MSISATVIQRNHITYAACGGKTQQVNCGDDVQVIADYWGVPVKDTGLFRGYDIQKAASQPTFDSIPLVRVIDVKGQNDVLHILGTVAQFNAACADEQANPMPLASTILPVVPEISSCDFNNDGVFEYYWAIPTKAGSDEYRAYVSINGQQSVPAAGAGHANVAAMITWLNTNYSSAGTWSAVDTNTRVKLAAASALKVGLIITVGNYA